MYAYRVLLLCFFPFNPLPTYSGLGEYFGPFAGE